MPPRNTPPDEVAVASPRPPIVGGPRRPSDIEAVGIELISGLFTLMGLAAFGLLFVGINSDKAIQAATQGQGSLVLAFLDSFGIITPVLVLVIGWLLIRLGRHLRRRTITAARWAQVALVWSIVAVIILGIRAFSVGGKSEGLLSNEPFQVGKGLMAALPFLPALIVLGGALIWLSRVMPFIFEGQEPLSTRDTRMAWNLLIPTLAVLILVAARPLEETFITSLTDKRFAGTQEVHFVGLENYRHLLGFRLDTVECRQDKETHECQTDAEGNIRWQLIDRDLLKQGYRPVTTLSLGGGRGLTLSGTDADFLQSILNTLHFTVVSVALELVLGLFMAMVVNSKFRGRGLMRMAMLAPWAIPTVVSARLWEIMLRDNQSGIINKLLLDVGLIHESKAWLSSANLQINALIMVDVWKTAPFMALLLLAGLQLIPKDLYEAAAVDGASKVRQFFSITIPLLRPTIAVALVFRTLDALRVFDVFQVLLGRRKLSMATYNYETLVQNQDGGYASAIGVFIFLLIFVFAVIYVRALGVETE